MGCFLLIREGMDTFSAGEARLGRYLLDHGGGAARLSTQQLAALCGVSPATVIRFAKKLGFSGFTSLKLDLAKESAYPELPNFETAIRDGDSMETIIRKAEQIHLRSVSETYRIVSADTLSQAADRLLAARRIFLFGLGASGLLAMDFQNKLARVGMPAFFSPDPHVNLACAPLLTPEDAAVMISYSGETAEVILAARAARERGCPILAVTQPNCNTLAGLADYPLYIPGEEKEFRVGAMTSRNAGLLLLDLLYLGVARHDPEGTQVRLHSTRAIVDKLHKK